METIIYFIIFALAFVYGIIRTTRNVRYVAGHHGVNLGYTSMMYLIGVPWVTLIAGGFYAGIFYCITYLINLL